MIAEKGIAITYEYLESFKMDTIQAKNRIISPTWQFIDVFINDRCLAHLISVKTYDPAVDDLLVSPWGGLYDSVEETYVRNLLTQKINCHLPILVCSDDLDLSCTVVVADVEFQKDIVLWKRCGVVSYRDWSETQARNSGLNNKKLWTDSDWIEFADTLALSNDHNKIWDNWILDSSNREKNEARIIQNYYHSYLNNPENIYWFEECAWSFSTNEYNKCIQDFLKILDTQNQNIE